MAGSLSEIAGAVIGCRRCPRLVEWRESACERAPARFRGQEYWSRPVPGFGDPSARLVVVGLAPAANGGNRTGRIFTGDSSGDWLFRALHAAGFANQPLSHALDDGLVLRDCYVTAVVRCAPPANKPSPQERDRCIGYLAGELEALGSARVIIALGAFAWDGVLRALRERGFAAPPRRPAFGHGAAARIGDLWILGSYHPSQQNTFTGKLTQQAFNAIFSHAAGLL